MHQIKPLCCELARTFGREGIAIPQSFPPKSRIHSKVEMIKALFKKNLRDFHISEKFIDIISPYVFFFTFSNLQTSSRLKKTIYSAYCL